MLQRKHLTTLILAATMSQCSAPKESQREKIQAPTPVVDPVVIDDEIPLLQLPASGTQMRFLDALALTDIYSRVFIRDANGRWKGCGNEAAWCQKSVFSKAEAKFLGTFSLYDGVDSFRVKKDFTLNYTRNLRAMLYRECRNLVDIEWDRVNNPDKPNVLVFRQGVPETTDLDKFSRKLFGLEGTDLSIDNMSAQYRAAFVTSVGTKTDAATLKSGYVVACMALAMDPAIFLY